MPAVPADALRFASLTTTSSESPLSLSLSLLSEFERPEPSWGREKKREKKNKTKFETPRETERQRDRESGGSLDVVVREAERSASSGTDRHTHTHTRHLHTSTNIRTEAWRHPGRWRGSVSGIPQRLLRFLRYIWHGMLRAWTPQRRQCTCRSRGTPISSVRPRALRVRRPCPSPTRASAPRR